MDAAGGPLPDDHSSLHSYLHTQQQEIGSLARAVHDLACSVNQLAATRLPPAAPPAPGAPVLPRPAPPERYGGDPEGCKRFLLTCELYLADYPNMTDVQKVSFVTQHLTGRALDWATAVWSTGGATTARYRRFLEALRAVFDHPDQGKTGERQLLRIKQGSTPVAEYAVKFQVLAAESGWCDKSLLARFRVD